MQGVAAPQLALLCGAKDEEFEGHVIEVRPSDVQLEFSSTV